MKNKKKEKRKSIKISLLTWSLVILSGVYIGMSFFTQTVAADVPNDTIIGTEDSIIGDLGDENQDGNQDGNQDDDEISIPTGNAVDLINYALNIYNNGKGSQSTVSCTITANASMLGLTGSIVQHYEGNILRCGNENLEEFYFYYQDEGYNYTIQSMFGQYNVLNNYYRAINVDNDNDKVYCVQTNNFNRQNQTYDLTAGELNVYTKEEAKEKFVMINSEEFPLEINQKTVSVKTFDTRTNQNYYIVSISYYVDKLPEKLSYYYKNNSALGVVSYEKYEYTFLISKKTGRLRKMTRTESFTSMGGPDGMVFIKTDVKYEQNFTKMDTPVEVAQPYLEHPDYPKES